MRQGTGSIKRGGREMSESLLRSELARREVQEWEGIFLSIIFRFREEGTQGLCFTIIFEELKNLD
jgi:hypothetical protein